jgi:hypothetical protein
MNKAEVHQACQRLSGMWRVFYRAQYPVTRFDRLEPSRSNRVTRYYKVTSNHGISRGKARVTVLRGGELRTGGVVLNTFFNVLTSAVILWKTVDLGGISQKYHNSQ